MNAHILIKAAGSHWKEVVVDTSIRNADRMATATYTRVMENTTQITSFVKVDDRTFTINKKDFHNMESIQHEKP